MSIDVLTISSKGQLALPTEMRKRMSIKQGDKFAVYSNDEVIMLKPLKLPTKEEFASMVCEAQSWAENVNLTEEDVENAIKTVREKKRK